MSNFVSHGVSTGNSLSLAKFVDGSFLLLLTVFIIYNNGPARTWVRYGRILGRRWKVKMR